MNRDILGCRSIRRTAMIHCAAMLAGLLLAVPFARAATVNPESRELLPPPAGDRMTPSDPLAQLLGPDAGVQSITSLTTDIRIRDLREGKPAGDVPPDVAASAVGNAPQWANGCERRPWMPLCYYWEASKIFRQPLYFEDWNLERYGYSPRGLRIVQPALSVGRFYAQLIALPYQMIVHPPKEPVYELGYYRPGSCAPYRFSRPELRPAAGALAAGFWVGLLLLIQ